ncbi:hypothetical protein E2C01_027786 [Portunus trituberculatus]|uniref:Uncharacterized protein n=1 Tax=Portunus trituberculatus TaxID=210409 RepID=A0A5B7EMK9_PORTR|nr:hypothetical protein [Portunus trituberculatus]
MNEAAQTGSLLSFDRKTISEILGETGRDQRGGGRKADRPSSRPRRRSSQPPRPSSFLLSYFII